MDPGNPKPYTTEACDLSRPKPNVNSTLWLSATVPIAQPRGIPWVSSKRLHLDLELETWQSVNHQHMKTVFILDLPDVIVGISPGSGILEFLSR